MHCVLYLLAPSARIQIHLLNATANIDLYSEGVFRQYSHLKTKFAG